MAFDILLLVSIFLTSFFSGIEQPKKKVECQDKAFTLLKLLFNDISLLVLRLVKIVKQGGYPYGSIIFVTKEVVSIISRLILLGGFCYGANNFRYNQLSNRRKNDVEGKQSLISESEL